MKDDTNGLFWPLKWAFANFLFRALESMEQLLEGFWGYMIGNMIAVFFVLCQILGKMQHGHIRYMQIINFSYFVW